MIDVTYGTYISEYTLAGLCMAAAFFLQHSLPVPADAVWLQSQGRFLVGGGWRSAQQKSVMLLCAGPRARGLAGRSCWPGPPFADRRVSQAPRLLLHRLGPFRPLPLRIGR